MKIEYKTIQELKGQLVFVKTIRPAKYQELVKFENSEGKIYYGQVLETGENYALIQFFESTQGIGPENVKVEFWVKL